jgi:hypothetical protein
MPKVRLYDTFLGGLRQEEAWKRVPPKEGEAKEKIVKEKTYHWFEHHMAWGIYPPKDCHLGLSRKEPRGPLSR